MNKHKVLSVSKISTDDTDTWAVRKKIELFGDATLWPFEFIFTWIINLPITYYPPE